MRTLIVRGACILGILSTGAFAQTAQLSLVPVGSTTINPGQTVRIEVFVNGVVSPKSLRTYQTMLEVIPVSGATGSLALADPVTDPPDNASMFVHPPGEPERTDWVFYGGGTSLWSGDVDRMMLGGLLFFGSVQVTTSKYCGTYIFKASDTANGGFDVRFRLMEGENPATFLRDPDVELISFTTSPTGGVRVTVQPAPLEPPNNNCVNSEPIDDGVTAFSTVNATTDGPALDASCDEGNGLSFEQDVWFDHTATCSGILTISTCNSATFNTRLAVYGDDSATCFCPTDNSVLLACDDDGPGCAGGTSEVALSVAEGACYTIRVGGLGTAEGTGNITIVCIPDDCTAAQRVTVPSSTAGTTRNATANDAIGPACGTATVVAPGVWYSVIGTGGRMTASLPTASFDTRLTVYGGSCGALTCVGGADNVGTSQESVSWCSTSGTL